MFKCKECGVQFVETNSSNGVKLLCPNCQSICEEIESDANYVCSECGITCDCNDKTCPACGGNVVRNNTSGMLLESVHNQPLVPIGSFDVEKGITLSDLSHEMDISMLLLNHLMQHQICTQDDWTTEHKIGDEVRFKCHKQKVKTEWRTVPAPVISSSSKMLDLIFQHNREAPECGIDTNPVFQSKHYNHFYGGWGYTPNAPCVILVDWSSELAEDNFGIGFENLFLERRIYEELIFDKSESKPSMHCLRWGITNVSVYVTNSRVFDCVRYTVTGYSKEDERRLAEDCRAHDNYENDPEGALRHLQLANSLRIGYSTECWFDITHFFYKPNQNERPKRWGAVPYEDKKLGVNFPVSLGDAKIVEGHRYNTEALGYSLSYLTGSGRTASGDMFCDLYVYTNGYTELTNGISAEVMEHFNETFQQIIATKPVAYIRQSNGDFTFYKTGLNAKWASVDLYYGDNSDTYSTILVLTSYRGHFIKLRCSCPLHEGADLPPCCLAFLNELDNLFSGK